MRLPNPRDGIFCNEAGEDRVRRMTFGLAASFRNTHIDTAVWQPQRSNVIQPNDSAQGISCTLYSSPHTLHAACIVCVHGAMRPSFATFIAPYPHFLQSSREAYIYCVLVMRHFHPMMRLAGRRTASWSLLYPGASREKGAAAISRVLIAAASKLCDAIKACLHLSVLGWSRTIGARKGGQVEVALEHRSMG